MVGLSSTILNRSLIWHLFFLYVHNFTCRGAFFRREFSMLGEVRSLIRVWLARLVTLQTVVQERNIAAALLVAWQRASSVIKEVLGDLGDLYFTFVMFIWGSQTLKPTGSAATSGFYISGLYRLMRKRGVWFVVLGGGRGRGSCVLLETEFTCCWQWRYSPGQNRGCSCPSFTSLNPSFFLLFFPFVLCFYFLSWFVSFCISLHFRFFFKGD